MASIQAFKGTCSGCEATWTGAKICHCAACHRSFSVLAWFDFHRSRGKCRDPLTLTVSSGKDGPQVPAMKINRYGVYVGAAPNARFTED